MSLRGEIAVVGVHEHPRRSAPDKTAYQIAVESARGALADAGLTITDVDGYATSGVGPIGVLAMCHHLNLQPDWIDSTAIEDPSSPRWRTPGRRSVWPLLDGPHHLRHRGLGSLRGGDEGPEATRPISMTPLRTDDRRRGAMVRSGTCTSTARRASSSPRSPSRCGATRAESLRQVPRPDHRRGRARLAHHLFAPPPPRLLRHLRRRRRSSHLGGRPGSGKPARARRRHRQSPLRDRPARHPERGRQSGARAFSAPASRAPTSTSA